MKIDTELLQKLCGKPGEGLEIFHSPHLIDVESKTFVMASNGYGCVWLDIEGQTAPYDHSDEFRNIVKQLPTEYKAIDLAALKAWLGEPEWRKKTVCETCKGRRKVDCDVCEGTGIHECDCGDTHTCGECDGRRVFDCPDCSDGMSTAMPERVGLFCGRYINLELAAEYLSICPDGDAEVGFSTPSELGLIAFRGDGWGAAIMPLRVSEPPVDADYQIWGGGSHKADSPATAAV